MNDKKPEREALQLVAEFHSELYECVDCFEQGVVNDLLLDSARSIQERQCICKALCAIMAQVTGGVNITSLLKSEHLRLVQRFFKSEDNE